MSKKRVNWLKKMLTIMAWSTFIVVVTIAVLGGSYAMWRLNDDQAVVFESEAEHFKYGSTGGERGWKSQFGFGIPYWMWIALPELVPERLRVLGSLTRLRGQRRHTAIRRIRDERAPGLTIDGGHMEVDCFD